MDKMEITILEDGTIKVETGRISGANHMSAETFLAQTIKEAGGVHERKSRPGAHHHHHEHGHGHDHHHH